MENTAQAYKILLSEDAPLEGVYARYPYFDIVSDYALAGKPDALIDAAGAVDALVIRNETELNERFFDAVKDTQLQVVGRLGSGRDNIDLGAAQKAKIPVVYAPDQNSRSTAEFAFATSLSAMRFIQPAHKSIIQGHWSRHAHLGKEMSEMTVGVMGYGHIGAYFTELINHMKPRKALIHNRTEIKDLPPNTEQVALVDLFNQADLISIHLPLTPSTEAMVHKNILRFAKDDLILINTSRGKIIVEEDLANFLRQNPAATAHLDVRAQEPSSSIGPFEGLNNVVFSPHIAGLTRAAQARVTESVFADIDHVIKGEAPQNPAF